MKLYDFDSCCKQIAGHIAHRDSDHAYQQLSTSLKQLSFEHGHDKFFMVLTNPKIMHTVPCVLRDDW